MTTMGSDLRFAFRTLMHERWSSLAAVLTLGVGIGVATAVYAVFNYALFRPVPGIRHPDQLVSMYIRPDETSRWMSTATQAHLEALRTLPDFAGLASYRRTDTPIAIDAAGPVTSQPVTLVTAGYFETLGVTPAVGRLIGADEYERSGATIAVISQRFWRVAFGDDPAIVGRTLRIRSQPFTVVGVAHNFRGVDRVGGDDIWIPYGAISMIESGASLDTAGHQNIVGRLKAGVSLERARADARHAFDAVGAVTSRNPTGSGRLTYTAVLFPGLTDGIGLTAERLRDVYWVTTGGVALLFALACLNVANLLISRNLRRRHSLALKSALGASSLRVFRELLIEATTLSVVAGLAGYAMGAALTRLFQSDRLLSYLPPLEDLSLDWRVAGYTFAVGAATVFLAAAWPSFIAARPPAAAGLTAFTRGSTRGRRLRTTLIGVQVTLSIALLMSAGVLGRTAYRLEHADLGFDPHDVLTLSLRPRVIGYDAARGTTLFRELESRLNATPGIVSAGFAYFGQMELSGARANVRRSDEPAGATRTINARTVSSRYLATLGIPLRAGRTFTASEDEQRPRSDVALIDEALATMLFGSASPLGQLVVVQDAMTPTPREIIGVVGNTAARAIRDGFAPTLYLPVGTSLPIATFQVRTALAAGDAAALVRRVLHDLEPGLPVEISTVQNDVRKILAEELVVAKLGWVVSLLALGIAIAGIYAVVACAVAERTREFGIRIAIGASQAVITRAVLRGTLITCSIGAAAGVALYAMGSKWVAPRLYHVGVFDALTMIVTVGVLIAGALLASWQPARRAARVDPIVSLRAE